MSGIGLIPINIGGYSPDQLNILGAISANPASGVTRTGLSRSMDSSVWAPGGTFVPAPGMSDSIMDDQGNIFKVAFDQSKVSGIADDSMNLWGRNGMIGTGLYGLGVLGGIGSGILNYLTGQQSLALARDQINFQKALANRNIANQAKIINNQYDASAGVAAAMASTGNGLADSQLRSRLMSQAKDRHVNGGYIG